MSEKKGSGAGAGESGAQQEDRGGAKEGEKSKSPKSPSGESKRSMVVDGRGDGKGLDNPKLTMFKDKIDELQGALGDGLTVVVLGASGALAKSKIFPALFSLFYHDLLPKDINFVGYARSENDDEKFRDALQEKLVYRVLDRKHCEQSKKKFLKRCHYVRGQYDSKEDMARLAEKCEELEGKGGARRLFYLAIPPSVFGDALKSIKASATSSTDWTKVAIEKPYGKDLETYKKLHKAITDNFDEKQVYLIDHFLGKDMVQNITTLRNANYVLGALWSKEHIKSVQIIFKEDFGAEGRAGYFDDFGIIRDVMQNHLLQVLVAVGMEPSKGVHFEDTCAERLAVLKAIQPLTKSDILLGQYDTYTDDKDVSDDSTCPTFATIQFQIKTPRWEGVPFIMKAGKGLDEHRAEVRIEFRGKVFGDDASQVSGDNQFGNELVFRLRNPNAGAHLSMVTRVPGAYSKLDVSKMDFWFQTAFARESNDVPDAYERLLLDTILGEKGLMISDEQAEISWRIFDKALHELEDGAKPEVHQYKFKSEGPVAQHETAANAQTTWSN